MFRSSGASRGPGSLDLLALQKPLQLFELLHRLVFHIWIGDLETDAVCGPAEFTREHLRQDPSHDRNHLRKSRTRSVQDHQSCQFWVMSNFKLTTRSTRKKMYHFWLILEPDWLGSVGALPFKQFSWTHLDHNELLLSRFPVWPVLPKTEVNLKRRWVLSLPLLELD